MLSVLDNYASFKNDDMSRGSTASLPQRPESETLILLSGFLGPILKGASSWRGLREQLTAKSYVPLLREDHVILMSVETRQEICTSGHLGVTLSDLTARLGAPLV